MIKLAKEKMVKCKVLPMEGEPGEALEIQMFVSQMAMNKIETIKKNGLGQDNSIYIGRVSAKPEVLQALKDNWRYRFWSRSREQIRQQHCIIPRQVSGSMNRENRIRLRRGCRFRKGIKDNGRG